MGRDYTKYIGTYCIFFLFKNLSASFITIASEPFACGSLYLFFHASAFVHRPSVLDEAYYEDEALLLVPLAPTATS